MQPWHCVLLIVLTLSLFFYGAYYQDIREESQAPLALSYEEDFPKPVSEDEDAPEATPEASALQELADSENWAEHRVLLVVENGTPSHTSLHSDALELAIADLAFTIIKGMGSSCLISTGDWIPFQGLIKHQRALTRFVGQQRLRAYTHPNTS